MSNAAAEPTESVADPIGAAASLSRRSRAERLEVLFRRDAATRGEIAVLVGEAERSEDFRDEGATSMEAWLVESFGVAAATARTLAYVGGKAWDAPKMVASMCAGEVSFDKVRTLIHVATPETDQELSARAKECTVRELADLARLRTRKGLVAPSSAAEHEGRYLRFNDRCRTISARLPAETYARTRARIDALAASVPSDSEARLDQRRCDGFTRLTASPAHARSTPGGPDGTSAVSPYFVVVHAPLDALVSESAEVTELAGELERDGLVDCATVQRLACDATIAVAVDDDAGHTMYEGRARRFPSQSQRREVRRRDRQCRFPGCDNATFTNVHHIVPWKPGGTTDLPNLALLCEHHHGVVHRSGWSMSGNANEALRFTSPGGRVMVSRPSPLWTRVTARSRGRPSG